MKKTITIIISCLILIGSTSCQSTPSNTAEQQKVITQMRNEIHSQYIKEFYEKKMTKEIFELRDNSKLITYVYFQAMNGKLVFLGQCVDFGSSNSTQYTKLIYVNEETVEREIIYIEPAIVVTQSKLPKRLCEPWSLPENY